MKIKKNIRVFIYSLILVLPLLSHAHEMRPAFLQIKQTGLNQYDVVWKIPRIGNEVMSIKPVFPDWFVLQNRLPAIESGTGALYLFKASSLKDIHGMRIEIDGLKTTVVDVLVQVDLLNGERFSFMLQPGNKSSKIPNTFSRLETISGYFSLGIEHILSGLDHLLFLLALLIITKGIRKLLLTVTSFTVAHSVTLSLAALGQISLPAPPVEAVIALSIVFLALEIIRDQQGKPTLTSRKPWLVAFIFGLLHGLGFAGALIGAGLPQLHIPLALTFFNVGVEIGQLFFVIAMLLIIKIITLKINWPIILMRIPPYAIGSIAVFWMIERVIGFWQ